MEESSRGGGRAPAHYLYEFLFSGTIALAFVTTLIFSSVYWSGQFAGWMMGLNLSFHRAQSADLGMYLAFSVWSLAVALGIFALIRAFSRVPLIVKPIRRLSGTIAIAIPAVCFWIVWYFQPTYVLYANGFRGYKWLPFEESIAIICVLLYLYKRWPVSVWTSVVLLALHSALWYGSYAVTFAGGHPNLLAIPIVACVSLLVWGYYVRHNFLWNGD